MVSVQTRPHFANPLGTVHGGLAAPLLDAAMGCAVHTTLPAGVSCTTLELKLNDVRAVQTGGETLTATGTVIHAGRRVATAEGRVVVDRDRLTTRATTTCLIPQARAHGARAAVRVDRRRWWR